MKLIHLGQLLGREQGADLQRGSQPLLLHLLVDPPRALRKRCQVGLAHRTRTQEHIGNLLVDRVQLFHGLLGLFALRSHDLVHLILLLGGKIHDPQRHHERRRQQGPRIWSRWAGGESWRTLCSTGYWKAARKDQHRKQQELFCDHSYRVFLAPSRFSTLKDEPRAPKITELLGPWSEESIEKGANRGIPKPRRFRT